MTNPAKNAQKSAGKFVAGAMWRRLDSPGHDCCRLIKTARGWRLEGMAVFRAREGRCALGYIVDCTARFETRSARVSGYLGDRAVRLAIRATPDKKWYVNGRSIAAVGGCDDVDINFSPATNLLSLRRVSTPMEEEIRVRTAWLKFPELELRPLEQIYRRTGDLSYAYSAPRVRFRTELQVDRHGFVVEYPPLWSCVK